MINYFLGIEYSKERIKCALASYDGKKYEVSTLKDFEEDALSSSLQKLIDWKVEKLGNVHVKVIASISESTIFLKELTVPNAKKESLDEAIYWELSSASPLTPSQAIYEWMPLKTENSQVSVIAMAVREAQITSITDELEKANMDVITVEPGSVALSRAAGDNYERNTMLLMVGDNQTDIVVMKNGVPVFSTTADVQLKRAKDEKWKLSKAVADEIAQKTKELISYWEEKSSAKIEQVLITGDLVDKYFGLAASINTFANVPVNIARQKTINGLTFAKLPKAYINRYFIAIGLLARFMGDPYNGVNLISNEKRLKINREVKKNAILNKLNSFIYIFGMYLVCLSVSALVFWGIKSYYDRSINETRRLVSSHPGQSLIQEINKTNLYLRKIDELTGVQKDQGINLRKISDLTPREIRLSAINYTKKESSNIWNISGTGTRESVLAYHKKLESELKAKSVTMPYSNLDSDTENKFEINIIW